MHLPFCASKAPWSWDEVIELCLSEYKQNSSKKNLAFEVNSESPSFAITWNKWIIELFWTLRTSDLDQEFHFKFHLGDCCLQTMDF